MNKPVSCTPETAAGNTTAADIVDKKLYAARWLLSLRTIDNLLRAGLPHMAVGRRRIRICVPEADAWMRERYFTQRRNGAKTKADYAKFTSGSDNPN
jgi:hypothetical protein